jgi:hypothetical protein
MPRCRKTRRRGQPNAKVSKDAEAEGPNAKVSKDAEAEATQPQRQAVERRGGGGNPTPTCRKTRRRREPSANTSKDRAANVKAQGTPPDTKVQQQRLGIGAEPPGSVLAVIFSFSFHFIPCTYIPNQGGVPPW